METVNERGIELMSLALEARVTNKILEIQVSTRSKGSNATRLEDSEKVDSSKIDTDSCRSLNLSLQMNRTFILDKNDT